MATAKGYDEWEDVGLAFTAEEVDAYDPRVLAEKRVAHLIDQAQVMERASSIPKAEKPAWHSLAAKQLIHRASWHCKAVTLEGFDKKEALTPPDPRSEKGKRLTARAQAVVPSVWLAEEMDNVEACLRYAVSIGRRAEKREDWTKSNRSLSNKFCNALAQERFTLDKLNEELNALPKPKHRRGAADVEPNVYE